MRLLKHVLDAMSVYYPGTLITSSEGYTAWTVNYGNGTSGWKDYWMPLDMKLFRPLKRQGIIPRQHGYIYIGHITKLKKSKCKCKDISS